MAVPLLALTGCAEAPTHVAPEIASLAAAAIAANQPVRLHFHKCPSGEGEWQGEVWGDIEGDLTTRLTGFRKASPIWQVRFDWIIDAGAQSFTADLSGILNTRTGSVVMNGHRAVNHEP